MNEIDIKYNDKYSDLQKVYDGIERLKEERDNNRTLLSKKINKKISNIAFVISIISFFTFFAFLNTKMNLFVSVTNSLLISVLFGCFCKGIVFAFFEDSIKKFLINNNEDIKKTYEKIKSLTKNINSKKEELIHLKNEIVDIEKNVSNENKLNEKECQLDDLYFDNVGGKIIASGDISSADDLEKFNTNCKKLIRKKENN